MEYFEIEGGKKLAGEVSVNSSKNAAVAVLLGSLVNRGRTVLKNVPQIEEINRLLEVLESVGIEFEKNGRDITIMPANKIRMDRINRQAAERTRSIILLIGALAGRLERFDIPQAGGCRLGSRTVKPHVYALENFGLEIKTEAKNYAVKAKKLRPAETVMYEAGDTATENALLAAAQIPGKSVIRLASANYMVQDLCFFLQKLGVRIEGVGTMTLEVEGLTEIKKDVEYEISEDPIEAMFFLSVAATTGSQIKIKRCPIDFLRLELLKLEKMGLKFKILNDYQSGNGRTKLADIEVYPSKLTALPEKIHPATPSSAGINIDNLPFFVPVATQAKGKTLIHDWVYETRAIYFSELNRLGARVTLMDAHRVYVEGPSKLRGADLMSPPALRPAAIILVAMLAAKGRSILRNIYSIKRGYENLEERLSQLGASIKVVNVSETLLTLPPQGAELEKHANL